MALGRSPHVLGAPRPRRVGTHPDRPEAYGCTIEEHVRCAGDLVDHLQLDGFITMGHDWGGPVSLGVATVRPERVRGVIKRFG